MAISLRSRVSVCSLLIFLVIVLGSLVNASVEKHEIVQSRYVHCAMNFTFSLYLSSPKTQIFETLCFVVNIYSSLLQTERRVDFDQLVWCVFRTGQ